MKWMYQCFGHNVKLLFCLIIISSCSYLSRNKTESVPKLEYDKLYEKYEALLKSTRPTPKKELVNTVDIFPVVKKKVLPVISEIKGKEYYEYNQRKVRVEIEKLFSAQTLLEEKKYDQALKLFREVKKSQVRQVRVYAQYYIGELLFNQDEFDLSLQVFEEIIQNHAFSGVVLKSLEKLVICSDKLSLTEKRDQYNSILNDFFKYNLAI